MPKLKDITALDVMHPVCCGLDIHKNIHEPRSSQRRMKVRKKRAGRRASLKGVPTQSMGTK